MKAAQITSWNTTPTYVDLPSPPAPTATQVQIKVLAAGIHRLVRLRTTGTHPSATQLPHIPGSDGVGRTLPDGKLVYFSTFWEGGSMAELVNVDRTQVTEIPEDADPVHRVEARYICALAAAGKGSESLEPTYLRPPDAERWRERDSFQRAD